MACVVLVIRTVDVAVTERELQIGRDLAAPLLTLRVLLRETEYFSSPPLMLFASQMLAKEMRQGMITFVGDVVLFAICFITSKK